MLYHLQHTCTYHNSEMDQARNAAPNRLAFLLLDFGSSIGSKASGIHLPFYAFKYLTLYVLLGG